MNQDRFLAPSVVVTVWITAFLITWTQNLSWIFVATILLCIAQVIWYESELIQLRRQLKITEAERDSAVQAASIDPLTGLLNRRGISLLTQKILGSRMRLTHDDVHTEQNSVYITVAVIDLDGFKAVNDTLGHAKGDEIILLAGVLLRRYFARGTDMVCRLGGDEFLVFIIGSDDIGSTVSRLEQFRQVFGAEARRFLPEQVRVTASCGVRVESIPEGDIDLDALIKQADTLMYHAKEKGKDAIVVG